MFEKEILERINRLERELNALKTGEHASKSYVDQSGQVAGLYAGLPFVQGAWAHVPIAADFTWAIWKPTVTYGGGTTDPTNTSVTAYYMKIGELVYYILNTTITRGSSDRTSISYSIPVPAHSSGLLAPASSIGSPLGSHTMLYSYHSKTSGTIYVSFGGTIVGTTIYIRSAGFYMGEP